MGCFGRGAWWPTIGEGHAPPIRPGESEDCNYCLSLNRCKELHKSKYGAIINPFHPPPQSKTKKTEASE